MRDIVEPKPSGGTQQRSQHRRKVPGADQGRMTNKTIPEARRIATELAPLLSTTSTSCNLQQTTTRDLLGPISPCFLKRFERGAHRPCGRQRSTWTRGGSVRKPAFMCAIAGHTVSSAGTAWLRRSPPRSTTSAPRRERCAIASQLVAYRYALLMIAAFADHIDTSRQTVHGMIAANDCWP